MRIFILIIAFSLQFQNLFSQTSLERIDHISDSIFETHLTAREYLTGGVISIVSRDSIIYLKGYGKANREKNKQFNPSTTVVQIASVTKLITTTALLQLLEENKIDLDKPVKYYLPNLKYKNPYDKKVLVRDLLTHTGGFDDRSGFMESKTLEEVPSLKTFAENYIPSVIWEPGKYFNYSNYSFVIVAYLVETLSEVPFQTYVDQNILRPLEMSHSGFVNEPELMENLMIRYRLRENQDNEIYTQKADPRYTNLMGVTGFKTTADDMTHFMMMYLNDGIYKGKQILKKETIDNAFRTHFTYDDNISRQQGLGWRIEIKGGKKMLYHYGDDTGVESSLVLFPESKIGLFTAFNNPVGFDVKTEIQDIIYKELYGTVIENPEELNGVKTPLKKIAGSYFYMNDSHTTFEKIGFLLGDRKINVKADGDTLILDKLKFKETSKPLLFHQIEGPAEVKFIEDENGEINHYSYGTSTFRRIGKWEDPSLHLKILIGCFTVFIIFLITALLRFIGSKFYKKKGFTTNKTVRIVAINTLCIILFLIGFFIATSTISNLSYGVDFTIKSLFILPIIAVVLLPISGYFYFKEIKKQALKVWLKLLLFVDLIAIFACLLIFNIYNLIGFHFI